MAKRKPLQELLEFALLVFEAAQRFGAVIVERTVAARWRGTPTAAPNAAGALHFRAHAVHLLLHALHLWWGFDGIVVSDYAGVEMLQTAHHLTDDPAVVASMALKAGVDLDSRGCPPMPARSGPPSTPGWWTWSSSTRQSAGSFG